MDCRLRLASHKPPSYHLVQRLGLPRGSAQLRDNRRIESALPLRARPAHLCSSPGTVSEQQEDSYPHSRTDL